MIQTLALVLLFALVALAAILWAWSLENER
jgi:hypothetical protein